MIISFSFILLHIVHTMLYRRADGSFHQSTYPNARARIRSLVILNCDEAEEKSGSGFDVSEYLKRCFIHACTGSSHATQMQICHIPVPLQKLDDHLRRERADSRPFGGVIMVICGNVLQMPQLQQRLKGIDSDGRLELLPDTPDYPWMAEVFKSPLLRILNVSVHTGRPSELTMVQ